MDDTIYYKLLGQQIRRARQERKITIEALAEKVGMSTNHIGDIERGNKRPLTHTYNKLCEALNLDAQKVFNQVKLERQKLPSPNKEK